jgi:hypothetical protein
VAPRNRIPARERPRERGYSISDLVVDEARRSEGYGAELLGSSRSGPPSGTASTSRWRTGWGTTTPAPSTRTRGWSSGGTCWRRSSDRGPRPPRRRTPPTDAEPFTRSRPSAR